VGCQRGAMNKRGRSRHKPLILDRQPVGEMQLQVPGSDSRIAVPHNILNSFSCPISSGRFGKRFFDTSLRDTVADCVSKVLRTSS